MEDHAIVKQVLERQPDLGSGDESKCLPGWIDTFCRKWEAEQGITLNHLATGALLHTLIDDRQRARRLVQERDEARREN